MGIEGADPAMLELGMPPSVNGGRPAGPVEVPNAAASAPAPAPVAPAKTLLVETSIRSGQSILHAEGDVTIFGIGRLRSGSRRRRLDPHLRRVARAGDRRLHGRRTRQNILQQVRG